MPMQHAASLVALTCTDHQCAARMPPHLVVEAFHGDEHLPQCVRADQVRLPFQRQPPRHPHLHAPCTLTAWSRRPQAFSRPSKLPLQQQVPKQHARLPLPSVTWLAGMLYACSAGSTANRWTMDRGSSKSRRASTKAGYLPSRTHVTVVLELNAHAQSARESVRHAFLSRADRACMSGAALPNAVRGRHCSSLSLFESSSRMPAALCAGVTSPLRRATDGTHR